MGKISDKLNGYKLPLSAITTVIITVIVGFMGYATLKANVVSNKEAVKALKDEPVKIARLEQSMLAVKEDVTDIKLEQREMQRDIKQILLAVTR